MWYPVANVRRVYVLQVGNIVMVDRHVVRKALRGTSAVWKNFFEIQTTAHCVGGIWLTQVVLVCMYCIWGLDLQHEGRS